MSRWISGILIYTALTHPVLAGVECNLELAFKQADEKGKRLAPVWDAGKETPLFFGSNLAINTDGNKRSYSVTDFWGEKVALNNLCNAMSDLCDGLSYDEKVARRKLTQEARTKKWPADLLAQTKIKSSIIPFRNGRPCPEVDDFLVSATAFSNPKIKDACDQNKYLDAVNVSAIVLPGRIDDSPTGFEVKDANVGDLVAVFRRDGKGVAFGVVGDTGPSKQLGEGTIKLAGTLLGKTKEPKNYYEITEKDGYEGQGWAMIRVYTIVFPGTRNDADPYLTQKRIDDAAAPLLKKWGGVERFMACRDEYLAAEAKK